MTSNKLWTVILTIVAGSSLSLNIFFMSGEFQNNKEIAKLLPKIDQLVTQNAKDVEAVKETLKQVQIDQKTNWDLQMDIDKAQENNLQRINNFLEFTSPPRSKYSFEQKRPYLQDRNTN